MVEPYYISEGGVVHFIDDGREATYDTVEECEAIGLITCLV